MIKVSARRPPGHQKLSLFMPLNEYMIDYFSNKEDLLERIKKLEKERNLHLLKKIERDPVVMHFYSFLSEIQYGFFFDTICDKMIYDQSIAYGDGQRKTPDWQLMIDGQWIIAETLRINGQTEEVLRQKWREDHLSFKAKKAGLPYRQTFDMRTVILDPHYYYEYQSKLTQKEEKYRDLIDDRQQPFLLCIDAMSITLLNEVDTYDFLIGQRRDGFFYTNAGFGRNITGVLFRGFGHFHCYYNENAAFPLTVKNQELLQTKATRANSSLS